MDRMEYLDWLQNLAVGDVIEVYWTAGSGGHYHGKARIKKVNRKSVVAELMEEVETWSGGTPYPVGNPIRVPTTPWDRRFGEFFNAPMPLGVEVITRPKRAAATRPVVEIAPGQEYDYIIDNLVLDGESGVDFEVTLVLEGRELAKALGVQERVLVTRLDQKEKRRDHLISERDLDAIFDMKHKSIHMGAMKSMADLLDYGSDVTVDLDGPQDNPYLSVKRIKPDAVQVTFEVGSIVTT
jgi:hypothetical protein